MRVLKRVFAAGLALLFVLSVSVTANVTVTANTLTEGDYEYTVSNGAATITKYNGIGGNINLPGSLGGFPVRVIGSSAFRMNETVTGVVIPNSVIEIGSSAFGYCSMLTSVTLSDSLETIGNFAFWNTNLASINIPVSVTWIGQNVFENTKITTVTIPAFLTNIGAGAFAKCELLTTINVASDNPNYTSENGVLFNKNKTYIVQYPAGKSGSYVVPSGVTRINLWAFSGCAALTELTIPRSVTYIGGDPSFENCDNLIILCPENSTAHQTAVNQGINYRIIAEKITVTVTAAAGGSASISGTSGNNIQIDSGAGATLQATPNTGYNFDGWYVGSTRVSVNNPFSFTSTVNATIQARFNLKRYTITAASGTGGVAFGSGTYNHNANVSLRAVAYAGYNFDGWYSGGSRVSANSVYSFNATAARTLNARFVLRRYSITAASGKNGKVSGGGTFNHGTRVTLRATANKGYAFDGWFRGKTKVSSSTSYAFNAIQSDKLQARFSVIKVKSVQLNRSSLVLSRREKFQLNAAISPSNAKNRNVTWKSSNPKVVSVTKKGRITARKRGAAIITVTTKDGKKKALSRVIVGTPAKSIKLNRTRVPINVNGTVKLRAALSPRNTNPATVTWTTSDAAIATVSSNGTVTGCSPGTAVITGTTWNGRSRRCRVTVRGTTPSNGSNSNTTPPNNNNNNNTPITPQFRFEQCRSCFGRGFTSRTHALCSGRGYIMINNQRHYCATCNNGRDESTCFSCSGRGQIQVPN
ncbi:MAG: leucine-rich repeat protein [Oscillospiraceae bacterium]|nr:leucine-rich repeat protein [Oscillospiraceae bacterium]